MPYFVGEVEVVNEVHLAPTAVIRDGAVEADCDLTISVQPFFYDLAGVHGRFPGALGVAVVDDATNYVYLDGNEALQVTTGSYSPYLHIRLARVITAGGVIVRICHERAFLSAVSSGVGDAKSGKLIPGNFSGNPKIASVAFSTAYPDSDYTVTFGTETIGGVQFVPVVQNKSATGFDVNLSVNSISSLVELLWQTMPVGE